MGEKRKGGQTPASTVVWNMQVPAPSSFSLSSHVSLSPKVSGSQEVRTRRTISFPPLAIVPPPQFAIASKKGGRRTWGPIENNSLPTWKRPSPAPFNYRAASARLHLLFSGQESWHSSLRSSSLCARMAPVALSPSQFIRFFPISFVCLPPCIYIPRGEEHLRYAFIIIEGGAHPELSCPRRKKGKKQENEKRAMSLTLSCPFFIH